VKHTLRRLCAGLVVIGAVGMLAAVAAAASPTITFVSPPSPAEGATLTTSSADFDFTYDRQVKATRSLTCVLAGPTPSSGPCDTPVAAGQPTSSSGASYSGLANSDYTLTVTLRLTDGGTATAVRNFSVNPSTCVAGSEDFSGFAEFDQPATFAGGTIDITFWGTLGGILVQGSTWPGGTFAAGTRVFTHGIDELSRPGSTSPSPSAACSSTPRRFSPGRSH